MKAYIQVKQVEERRYSIEKMSVDSPTPPASVRELIEAVVCWQVKEYDEQLQQSEMLKYLICEGMEDKAAAGGVDFGANYNGRPTVRTETIVGALQSYEDGISYVFLDDAGLGELSPSVRPKEESVLTFIRPAMLPGRFW